MVFSASIGRQVPDHGPLDQIDLHIVPVLTGDDHSATVDVRYRPARAS